MSGPILQKIPPSKEKAFRSIKRRTQEWLREAQNTFKSEAFNSSVLASYLVMLHSARIILFFDGFREKSHACVARYLEEKYVKTGKLEKKWVELLDHYREHCKIRPDGLYDLSFSSTKEEAEKALKSAPEFLIRMKELLNLVSK